MDNVNVTSGAGVADTVDMPGVAFSCLVVGVGGQGVVLASRLVAAACMAQGRFVRTAETIGMSQRGGSVASHVRASALPGPGTVADGASIPSSLIPRRGADLVLAFEPGEALRAHDRLALGGSVVCATRPVMPVAAGGRATAGYDGRAQLAWLGEHLGRERLAQVDMAVLADEGLSPKCANVLLLGAALRLGALPFSADELRAALRQLMKPKLVDMNLHALELGMGGAAR